MTHSEFMAWLDGYSHSFSAGCPNKEQWETIKAKFAECMAPTLPIPYVIPQRPFNPDETGQKYPP